MNTAFQAVIYGLLIFFVSSAAMVNYFYQSGKYSLRIKVFGFKEAFPAPCLFPEQNFFYSALFPRVPA